MPETLPSPSDSEATALADLLRVQSRVVAIQPWMVRELGIAAVWFAQLLWFMECHNVTTVARGDHEWEAETGLNRAQVLRAKTKVLERGWITCEVRKIRGTPTSHIALVRTTLDADLRAIHCLKSDRPGSRDNGQSSSSQMVLEVEEGRAASGEQSLTLFERFWAVYPRHVAKQAARKAWAAAVRVQVPTLIVEAAARYADEVSDRTPDKIAHPASWLNGRRWEDPPDANRSTTAKSQQRPQRGAAAPVTADRNAQPGRIKL